MTDSAFSTDPFIRARIADWLRDLASVRRLAPRTLEAYGSDLGQFMGFLALHMGGPGSLQSLRELRGADIRSFMAQRRGDGVGSRSLARALSALKSFSASSNARARWPPRRSTRCARPGWRAPCPRR